MELHIKEFEYQNIIKQQMYKQLATLSLCLLLLAFALESIFYDFDYAWIILFAAAMAIINLNFRKKKKILGYDLVYIDEDHRFFYDNTFIEMKDLQNYVVSKETITLNFIDYSIMIEKDEKLYDYLNQFAKNTKPINVKKTKPFIFCMAILVMFFSLSLGNLVLGSIYSYVNNIEMVSFSTILIPVIQITSILLGVAFIFFVAKKFKKGIGISKNILEHIFDEFVTDANISNDSQKGVGLGLAICKAIIQAHGGEIEAKNDVRGACFVFTIPNEELNV